MIDRENQIMQIVYYNFKKKKAITPDFKKFLDLTKDFLLQKGYGLYMHNYQKTCYSVKPTDSLEKKLDVIKDYFDTLTNPNREDFLKYENLDLYCSNKRHELVWIIKYSNPILANRRRIYESMFNSQLWKYSFRDITEEIFNVGFRLLAKKYKGNYDSDYQENLNKFKKWNLMYSMKNESSNKFYNYIQDLLNLKSEY